MGMSDVPSFSSVRLSICRVIFTYNAGACRLHVFTFLAQCGAQLLVAAAHLSFCLADLGQGQVMAPRGLASLLSWGSYVHTKHIMDE